MRIGFMATAVMAAKKGMDAMAAHQVGMNLMGLTFSFGDGLQAAAVPAPTTQSVRCVVVSKGAVVKTCYTSNALPKDYIPSVQQL